VLGHKVAHDLAGSTANALRAQASTGMNVPANGASGLAAPAAKGPRKVVVADVSIANAPPVQGLRAPSATLIATSGHAAPVVSVPQGLAQAVQQAQAAPNGLPDVPWETAP